MSHRTKLALATALLIVGFPLGLRAQFPSELVSFEGTPSGDPSNQEMFWEPQWSGSTDAYVIHNSAPGTFDRNAAFRNPNVNFATDGSQALEVLWKWVAQSDVDAWVRLTTFNHTVRPNPSLDTQGKVRFKITNFGYFSGGDVGVCLGVRETGVFVAQLGNGGTSGLLEWVGVDPTVNAIIAGPNGVADTLAVGDDIQAIPVGSTGLSEQAEVILPGLNGQIDTTEVGDDVARFGYYIGTNGLRVPVPAVTLPVSFFPYSVEWDLATGDVTVDDGFGPVTTPGAVAPFTGNGILDPANNRGALDHIAFTNVPPAPGSENTNPSVPDVSFGIDELQFEATVPDPVSPPTVVAPVFEGATSVQVQATPGATQTELFVNGGSVGTAVPDGNGLSTHSPLAALSAGDVLTAKQTKDAQVSDPSAPVVVFAVGVLMADDFDAYNSQGDLNVFWLDSVPSPAPPDAKVRLQAGGAASCPNFLREENPSGANAARLYRDLGGVNGTDASPLWVTWNFRYTGSPNSAGARTRFELAHFNGGAFSTGVRGEGTVGITLFNQVAGAMFTEYNLVLRVTTDTAILDDLTSNGWVNAGGFLRAASGVPHAADGWHKMQIEVGETYVNYYIDGTNVNPAGYETGVPRPNSAQPFTHVIIGEGFSNNGPMMMFDNVSVTQGAGGALHPFGDAAVLAPTVVSPLFPLDSTVSVTDIDTNGATEVRVFANGSQIGLVTTTGFASPTVEVPVSPSLGDGQLITATQKIGPDTSCRSFPVTVGVPAPSLDDPFLVPTQQLVTVGSLVAGSTTAVTVYANESTVLAHVTTTGFENTSTTVTVSPALSLGQQITATQTIGAVEGVASAARTVAVPAPVLPALTRGATEVTVESVHPLATSVAVYVNDSLAGSNATGGATSVPVTLSASLQVGDTVEATQTIGGTESARSDAVVVGGATCVVIYSEDFDVDPTANWTINHGPTDDVADFFFDYSSIGIPPAPNSSGTTRGLKMQTNLTSAIFGGFSVSPTGQSFTGSYTLTFDVWSNFNGPFPDGGSGSTNLSTYGILTSGTFANYPGVVDAVWFGATGDGGSSADWRAYSPAAVISYQDGDPVYAASTRNHNNLYYAVFGGVTAPAAQLALFPQQTGTTLVGSAGMTWHEVDIVKTGDIVTWSMDGVLLATVDTSAMTLGGSNIMFGHSDINATSSADPNDVSLLFTLIDNVRVLVAQPDLVTQGDWNSDALINLVDFANLADCLGGPGASPAPARAECSGACLNTFDFDADEDVDLFDFSEFARLLN